MIYLFVFFLHKEFFPNLFRRKAVLCKRFFLCVENYLFHNKNFFYIKNIFS